MRGLYLFLVWNQRRHFIPMSIMISSNSFKLVCICTLLLSAVFSQVSLQKIQQRPTASGSRQLSDYVQLRNSTVSCPASRAPSFFIHLAWEDECPCQRLFLLLHWPGSKLKTTFPCSPFNQTFKPPNKETINQSPTRACQQTPEQHTKKHKKQTFPCSPFCPRTTYLQPLQLPAKVCNKSW